MSIKGKENSFDDNRRVSFSLPRSNRLKKMAEEEPDEPDDVFDIDEPSVEVKNKKKWKIKLPWKQKKQVAYFETNTDDIPKKAHEYEMKDHHKRSDGDDSDIESVEKEDGNDNLSSQPPPLHLKENRPSTWYGGYLGGPPEISNTLDARAISVQITKEDKELERKQVDSPVQSIDEQFHHHDDDVDYVPDTRKKNKGKTFKLRLNFKAFNQKTGHTHDNFDLKASARDGSELSFTEESSSPDIAKSPLLISEDYSNKILSKLNTNVHNPDKSRHESSVQSPGSDSDRDHFAESTSNVHTVAHPKKSNSLPSIFKKSKKKKALAKEEFQIQIATSAQSPETHIMNEKTNALPSMSDSELHVDNIYKRDRSGSQPSIQFNRRRGNRSMFKMSRSSYISSSNASKSSDTINRNIHEWNDRNESVLKHANVRDHRSLDDMDLHKPSTSYQRQSSLSRNFKNKYSQKYNSLDLSNGDMGSPKHIDKQNKKDKEFDKNFKSDYAIKMNQASKKSSKSLSNMKSQKTKPFELSNSDVGSPERSDRNDFPKKVTHTHSDDLTKFIQATKSAKVEIGSQKKKSGELPIKTLETNNYIKEIIPKPRGNNESFKTFDDITKPERKPRSRAKAKTSKTEAKSNSSELSSSEEGMHNHSDIEHMTRKKNASEQPTEPNNFTEFIKNYNSSKGANIVLKSRKHTHQPASVDDYLKDENIHKRYEEDRKLSSSNEIDKVKRDFSKMNSHQEENSYDTSSQHVENASSFPQQKFDKMETDQAVLRQDHLSNKNYKSEQSFSSTGTQSTDKINFLDVPISDSRVRRRSYEEMTNLIEEQMFDSDSDNSDTDGDDVDLSFGRKQQVDLKSKDDDNFKLCIVTEKGSFQGTELVYEPKILPKKEHSTLNSKGTNNEFPYLRRPPEAPPMPPPEEVKAEACEELSPKVIVTKSEPENIKRKKLRKTQKKRSVSNSSDSDTSIEDSNGTLYSKFSPNNNFSKEDNPKQEQQLLTKKSDKGNVNLSDSESKSPPIFSPPVHADDNERIETLHKKYNLHQIENNLIENVNNKLASTSATVVAKSLFSQRDEKKNSLFKKNIDDLPAKSVHEIKPPSPPSIPPPEAPFVPDPISITDSYNLKNFSPKYEYAPNMPFVSQPVSHKRQPITSYSSMFRNEIGATSSSNRREKDKVDTLEDIDLHRQSFNRKEFNPDFMYVQNQFGSTEIKKSNVINPPFFQASSNEKSHDLYLSDIKDPYKEKYNTIPTVATNSHDDLHSSKRHITFHLPSYSKSDEVNSEGFSLKHNIHNKEHGNQSRMIYNDKSSYHSLPNNLQTNRLNGMPKSSPLVQRQMISMKEDLLRVSHKEEGNYYDKSDSIISYEEKFYSSDPKINIASYHGYESGKYHHGTESAHDRYIHMSSPIPYSKKEKQLKSILKSNYKRNDVSPSETTQPSLVQTNVKYIQPVSGEVRSTSYRSTPKQLIPSKLERVKISEDSSNSDSENLPPALPSYPPPFPRQNWQHQQKFLGGLLHSETNHATSTHSQRAPQNSSYYTPTIIEVEAHQGQILDHESVYQNIIHASQV